MTRFANGRFVAEELLWAAVSGLVALAIAIVALGVDVADLGRRWSIGGADQVLHYGIFTSALHTFPFLPNDQLGFPKAQNLFFAPLFDPWSAVAVWASGAVLPDGIWALNLYNLGSFLAVGFTSYAFFRALRLRRVTAVVFGVLFATVPYHFVQLGYGHPFLSNYWAVPLIGILVLMVAGERTDPFAGWVGRASSRRMRFWRRVVPLVVLVPAVALTQSYYFVFGVLLVGGVWFVSVLVALLGAGAGAGGGGWRARARALVWPSIATGSLVLLVGLQLAILSLNFGDRYEKYFGARSFTDSEGYGGKLIDLLLPSLQSGIPPLASLSEEYHSASTLIPDAETAATAVVASVAIVLSFVIIVLRLFGSRAPAEGAKGLALVVQDARIGVLLTAFLGAFLFFITAGLGTVLSFFGSPEIRAWSRMSIVVSMLALGVLAIVIERLASRRRSLLVVLAIVSVVAVFDQVPRIAPTVPLTPVTDAALRDFTAAAAGSLGPGCGVVQLPLKGFPETGPIGLMGDYDEILPSVVSPRGADALRWSYGAVIGTASSDYWKAASTMPGAFASATFESGACAIMVDTFAYSDSPGGWEPFVEAVGMDPSAPALISVGGRYLLFEWGR
ncbi:hypothetical protein B7R54_03725 [Subtercola boreus]|uniref:Glycosyltransferase RgtA/B/C/D-like domain-containing protein n=1 Tax=Subtercola boreus TaxID=120213 RepID=A0A3E0VGD6_9MICO|nr:hypothetical protein [Subtercola boreus]RFA08430.1 hypothetical protein B7R54_03725 [Subtercola boreus]TQL54654.1 hypothetical protein FB464_2196 [Subtercola boreus]